MTMRAASPLPRVTTATQPALLFDRISAARVAPEKQGIPPCLPRSPNGTPLGRWKMAGYVYLIGSRKYSWYKVGKTVNVKVRLADLRILLPFQVEVVAIWKTSGYHQLERQLHKRLASHRINGEWFSLKRSEVTAIVVDMAYLEVKDPALDFPNVEPESEKEHPFLSEEERELRKSQWREFAKNKRYLSKEEIMRWKSELYVIQRARSGQFALLQKTFDKIWAVDIPFFSKKS
jgi:hypothetical protein